MQYDCHTYLADIKKYSLPEHPFFRYIVCPHYLAECLIYTAIAVVAAPKGSVVNLTVWFGLVFVSVILGVSAKVNREWYRGKFGEQAVEKKWNMVPGVF
jgi:3-oxo-5-alpha-steroid 4-dehydrogenase 3